MDDATAGRAIRVVRLRLKLTQAQLAAACGLSQAAISRAERGHIDTLSLRTIRAIGKRLEMRAEVMLRWRGGELDRLLSRKHSALHERLAQVFARLPDWEPHPEVTFSIWGERGWVDILAWHPARRILLVIELKTDIVDIQDLIGRVDMRLVHRTLLEMHFGKPQIAALLADGRLVVDLPDEDRVVRPLSSGLRDAYHPHTPILAQTGTK